MSIKLHNIAILWAFLVLCRWINCTKDIKWIIVLGKLKNKVTALIIEYPLVIVNKLPSWSADGSNHHHVIDKLKTLQSYMTTVHDSFRETPLITQYLKQSKFLMTLVWLNIEENSIHKFIMYVTKKFLNISCLLLQHIFMTVSLFWKKIEMQRYSGKIFKWDLSWDGDSLYGDIGGKEGSKSSNKCKNIPYVVCQMFTLNQESS